MIGREPEVPRWLLDIYRVYRLLDRDGMSGRITLAGMKEGAELLGVTDPEERLQLYDIWRVMDAKVSEFRERTMPGK